MRPDSPLFADSGTLMTFGCVTKKRLTKFASYNSTSSLALERE